MVIVLGWLLNLTPCALCTDLTAPLRIYLTSCHRDKDLEWERLVLVPAHPDQGPDEERNIKFLSEVVLREVCDERRKKLLHS